MKIIISEFMDEAAVDQLRARFDVTYDAGLVDRPDDLLAAVAHADALIVRNRTQVNQALLAGAPQLKAVGRLGVGLDNIDVAACEQRNIQVLPATGANALAVAEYVIVSAMLLLRGVFAASPDIARGEWPRARLSDGRETGGKVLGLIGFGGIGQLAASLARNLGMSVCAYDPAIKDDAAIWQETGVRPVSLDQLLEQADVVSLHIPLLDSTRGLFDAARIAKMKPGAVLVNTSRGGIVDEAALVSALQEGRLGGAALDVFEQEPPTGQHLAHLPNLILTPHVAGVTAESNQRVSQLIADRVSKCLSADAAATAR
ncbi:hydroxyacid dehydrogenase [Pusillimonas sp. MFBS29]|uniref:hydroxyacid dehydrogenase n=1 Tax=Pusillimonas sp. MFBS29 TaxID=2886690 RepID=UPI001D0F6CEF|nr:hydroxyacid dehydrogenase [Pusillimonas sp. MFBS29]MCC2597624.1 hydroxyacid dehydrogenase [Pusillimonas sp. MFBS29]